MRAKLTYKILFLLLPLLANCNSAPNPVKEDTNNTIEAQVILEGIWQIESYQVDEKEFIDTLIKAKEVIEFRPDSTFMIRNIHHQLLSEQIDTELILGHWQLTKNNKLLFKITAPPNNLPTIEWALKKIKKDKIKLSYTRYQKKYKIIIKKDERWF